MVCQEVWAQFKAVQAFPGQYPTTTELLWLKSRSFSHSLRRDVAKISLDITFSLRRRTYLAVIVYKNQEC